ncbi:MAG: DUF2877 domain-containing protein [Alphaproteobacteria bacterium]
MIALFERSVYVEGRAGLACLGPPSLGAGPLNALCALPAGLGRPAWGLASGAPVCFGPGTIRIAGGPVFSLAAARDWRPPPLPREWRADDLRRGLAALAAAARARAPDAGMGAMIPALVAGASPSFTVAAPDPFRRAAAHGASALVEWLARGEHGPPALPADADVLIGLGPGLTPSGDDFVVGAMIALRCLRAQARAERLAAWALARAEANTGKISRAHLACAADGEGAAALHDALAALCVPGSASLATCLDAIDAIGHCSGWDALAGATAACAAFIPVTAYLNDYAGTLVKR